MNNTEKAFLEQILLTCPVSGESLSIHKVEGVDMGRDTLVITVKGKETAWEHSIFTSEVEL